MEKDGGGLSTVTFERAAAGVLSPVAGVGPIVTVRDDDLRVTAVVEALPAVTRACLDGLGAVLMAVAGEDRRDAGRGFPVHYLFGVPGRRGGLVVTVEADAHEPAVPSLASLSFPASRFERELRDLLGIVPAGHPDPRPLVRHGFWPEGFHPLRHDAVPPALEDDGRGFPFTPVGGEGVYEIPVGPVHAGVIEPGHFRFSVLGETILDMRARLYFTHKGTEKLFEGRAPDEAVLLAERISGDTSVGHAVAFCEAVERLAGVRVPERARRLRVCLLELERLYNHVTDVGALLADTGFPVGQSHCLRVREGLFRLHRALAGSRLLRGVVVPGGVSPLHADPSGLAGELYRLLGDFEEIVAIALDNTLVRDRLEGTGCLAAQVARDYGTVGVVARASGVADDARVAWHEAYDGLDVSPVVETGGDVLARFLVRVREARQSVDLVKRVLEGLPGEGDRVVLGALPGDALAWSALEGWRGRLVHIVATDARGRIRRVKVVDPSFFNWPALSRALEGAIVPDFPLCNKSFNQSYSGNDL
jgi:Ni,Fe-hydrogenase III large subunit/Ni,Fe-hydrogenase III component G